MSSKCRIEVQSGHVLRELGGFVLLVDTRVVIKNKASKEPRAEGQTPEGTQCPYTK